MNDQELDEMLGRLDPVDPTQLSDLHATAEARMLQESIFAATSADADFGRDHEPSFSSRVGSWLRPDGDGQPKESPGLGLGLAVGRLGSGGRSWMTIGTACLLLVSAIGVVALLTTGESENVVAVEPGESTASEELDNSVPVSGQDSEPATTQVAEAPTPPPESAEAAESTPGTQSPVSTGPFDAGTDLVSLHFANGATVDDLFASAAARSVTNASGVVPFVVGGSHGEALGGNYQSDSEPVMDAIWGSGGWLNANADRPEAARQTADRWREYLINGGRVWVAEGGPSDFTAEVIRLLMKNPDVDVLLKNVHVVQHSTFNEEASRNAALELVKRKTTYKRIDDGNQMNGTADLSEPNPEFQKQALASQDAEAWQAAYEYSKRGATVDFSDTVLLLEILDFPPSLVANTSDFSREFLQ